MATPNNPLDPEDRFDGLAVVYGAWMEHRRKKRERAQERFAARQEKAKALATAKLDNAQGSSAGAAVRAVLEQSGKMAKGAVWMAATTKAAVKDVAKTIGEAIRSWRATLAITLVLVVAHALALAFFASRADSLLWVNTAGSELRVAQAEGPMVGGGGESDASVARVLAAVSDKALGRLALKKAAGSSWALADKFDVLGKAGTRAVSDCLDASVCHAMNAIDMGDALLWQIGRPPPGMPVLPKKDAQAWEGSGVFVGNTVFVISWGLAIFVALMFGALLKKTASRGAPGSVARVCAGLASAQNIAAGMALAILAMSIFVFLFGGLGDIDELWPSSQEQAQSLLNQAPTERLNPGAIEWRWRRPKSSDWENRGNAGGENVAIAQACKNAGFCGDEKTARSKEAQSGLSVSQVHASAGGVWSDAFRWAIFFAAFVVWPVLLLTCMIFNQDDESEQWEKRIKSWGREGRAHAERQRLIQALPAMTAEQKKASVARKSHRI